MEVFGYLKFVTQNIDEPRRSGMLCTSNRTYCFYLLIDGLRDNATTFMFQAIFNSSEPASMLQLLRDLKSCPGCRLALQRDPATGLGKVWCPSDCHHVFSMGFEVEGGTLLPGSMGIERPGTAWPGWVGVGKKCATEELTVIRL